MHYLCREGKPWSAIKMNKAPTEENLKILISMGFEVARVGKKYRKNVVCPVNGDGYWYTRRELTDSKGFIVGSFRDDNGPFGEI